MIKKIFCFILTSSLFFASLAFAEVSSEQALNEEIPEEIINKINEEISNNKSQIEKEIKDLKEFLPAEQKYPLNIIEKNGQKIIEINSNILPQENDRFLFYIQESIENAFFLNAKDPNILEYKNKVYYFTDNPIFRFKIISAPESKIDFAFEGAKIKLQSQKNYVVSENKFRINNGVLSIIADNIEYPINFFPDTVFSKAINNYKNYEIQSADLTINNGEPEYVIKLKINGKILWLFQTSFDLTANMNAENGKINIDKPWWEPFVF